MSLKVNAKPIMKKKTKRVIEITEYKFTNYKQWDNIPLDCMEIFKKWYETNSDKYNHIKHAFNSLCKHFGLITIMKYEYNKQSELWKFTSFLNKSWYYQKDKNSFKELELSEIDKTLLKYLKT
jgi:hypothetical protein